MIAQYNSQDPQPSHFTQVSTLLQEGVGIQLILSQQVVWKGTTQVGCAEQLCDGIFAASFGVSDADGATTTFTFVPNQPSLSESQVLRL